MKSLNPKARAPSRGDNSGAFYTYMGISGGSGSGGRKMMNAWQLQRAQLRCLLPHTSPNAAKEYGNKQKHIFEGSWQCYYISSDLVEDLAQ